MSTITKIIKRSGEIADFEPKKIEEAIYKTTKAINRKNKAWLRSLLKR